MSDATQLPRTRLDSDPNAPPKPSGLDSYQAAHKEWFTAMYSAGIAKLQKQFVTAAEYLTHPDRNVSYNALPQEVKTQVELLVKDKEEAAKTLCGGSFAYP
jgi:hypothetical protein